MLINNRKRGVSLQTACKYTYFFKLFCSVRGTSGKYVVKILTVDQEKLTGI